jgi:hypothetical protein
LATLIAMNLYPELLMPEGFRENGRDVRARMQDRKVARSTALWFMSTRRELVPSVQKLVQKVLKFRQVFSELVD